MRYVDYRYTGPNPDGTLANPYPSVTQGVVTVANGGTVKVRTGAYAYPARLLSKNLRLESYDGRVVISATGAVSGAESTETSVQISPPRRQADGSVSFQFGTSAGQRYQILTSTNLADWELWQDFTAEGQTAEFIHPIAAGEPMRFFRVVVP